MQVFYLTIDIPSSTHKAQGSIYKIPSWSLTQILPRLIPTNGKDNVAPIFESLVLFLEAINLGSFGKGTYICTVDCSSSPAKKKINDRKVKSLLTHRTYGGPDHAKTGRDRAE